MRKDASPSRIPRLTLDTNVPFEHWRQRPKADIVRKLIDLARQGRVELAVTARIHEDIPEDPLASEINQLPGLGVKIVGSIARLDYCQLDRDILADDNFTEFEKEIEQRPGKRKPDWRDLDHLHAHYLMKRDVFLTWDRGILELRQELFERFGIVVKKPEEFLEEFLGGTLSP